MTLKLINVDVENESDKIRCTYLIIHHEQKTVLDQQVSFIYNRRFNEYSCQFNITDFPNMNSFEEAKEKLATWFERLAKGLREPTKTLDIPLYSGEKK